MTTEQLNEQNKQNRIDRINAKKSALQIIVDAVKASGDGEALKALSLLTVKQGRQAGSSTKSGFYKHLIEHGSIDELDCFKLFKMGRGDCRKATRHAVKALAPAERLYIMFDESAGVYTLEGQGENPPRNYPGYLPQKGIDRYNVVDGVKRYS